MCSDFKKHHKIILYIYSWKLVKQGKFEVGQVTESWRSYGSWKLAKLGKVVKLGKFEIGEVRDVGSW